MEAKGSMKEGSMARSKNLGRAATGVCVVGVVAAGYFSDLGFADIVPVLVSLIAGFVALSINETVAVRRKAELAARLREQREEVYRQLLNHLLLSFQGGPRVSEVEVRSQIALWGSPSLLAAYSAWRTLVKPLISPGESAPVPVEMRRPLQEAIARVCLEARSDLAIPLGDEPTTADLADVFFDDYKKSA